VTFFFEISILVAMSSELIVPETRVLAIASHVGISHPNIFYGCSS